MFQNFELKHLQRHWYVILFLWSVLHEDFGFFQVNVLILLTGWERQLSFFLCGIRVLCISSWMLGPKFISLHSQKNSSFLAGSNFKMSFKGDFIHLPKEKITTGTCAFTLQECHSHSIWFKWFVVSRLYLYCSSSFYIYGKYWTSLSLTASRILHITLSLPEIGIVCSVRFANHSCKKFWDSAILHLDYK